MTVQTWGDAVSQVLQNIWSKIVNFLPDLLGAIIVLIIGWIIADLIAWAIDRLLRVIRLPELFKSARIEELVSRAGSKLDTTALIASLVKWVLLLVTFVAAANILHLDTVQTFLNNILAYVPNAIAAGAIILIGTIFANFISALIRGALAAGNLSFVELVSSSAKYAILVFAFLAALSQLGIAENFLQALFTGFIAFLAIAGGLAFGLGGQSAAKDLIEKLRKEIKA